jgi:hypothetical protein
MAVHEKKSERGLVMRGPSQGHRISFCLPPINSPSDPDLPSLYHFPALPSSFALLPWRWKQQASPKQGIIFQAAVTFIPPPPPVGICNLSNTYESDLPTSACWINVCHVNADPSEEMRGLFQWQDALQPSRDPFVTYLRALVKCNDGQVQRYLSSASQVNFTSPRKKRQRETRNASKFPLLTRSDRNSWMTADNCTVYMDLSTSRVQFVTKHKASCIKKQNKQTSPKSGGRPVGTV